MSREEQTVQPEAIQTILQSGCKITAGARAGPPPPSWRLARQLVLSRRASSRIIKPAAASAIQKAYRQAKQAREEHAARASLHSSFKVWRATVQAQAARCELEELSAIALQAAARGHCAKTQRRALLASLLPALLRLQALARSRIASRGLHAAVAAARCIQSHWRMVRSRVVGQRLTGALARLQNGAVLDKYQKGGLSHERRRRFVWLSKDRQKLCWTEPSAADSRCSATDKSVDMEAITAVSAGVKTKLMKKMGRRAEASAAELILRKPVDALLSGAKAQPLDASCAFSLIGRDRVLDLVAPSEDLQAQWLRDLRTLLLFGHHLDHSAGMDAITAGMGRGSLADPVAAAA